MNIMKQRIVITVLLVSLALATSIFLMTAIVKGEGGPGVELVLKPFHGLVPLYGGGEEGRWRRQHPGDPAPWWQDRSRFTRLVWSEAETSPPTWEAVYIVTYILTAIGWIAAVSVGATRVICRRIPHRETNIELESIRT